MNYYDRSLDALMHAYGRYNVTFDHGDGIHLYDVNVEEGTLTERKVIPVNNSSHIARSLNGKYLYSIADVGVAVFAVEDDGDLKQLKQLNVLKKLQN